jgi:hypothetical protein
LQASKENERFGELGGVSYSGIGRTSGVPRKNAGVGREIRAHLFFADGMAGPPTIEDRIVDIDRRKPIFSRSSAVGSRFIELLSSRIKPLLEMRLEALEHLFFNVFDVGEPVPTSDIAVFTGTLNLQNEFFY